MLQHVNHKYFIVTASIRQQDATEKSFHLSSSHLYQPCQLNDDLDLKEMPTVLLPWLIRVCVYVYIATYLIRWSSVTRMCEAI